MIQLEEENLHIQFLRCLYVFELNQVYHWKVLVVCRFYNVIDQRLSNNCMQTSVVTNTNFDTNTNTNIIR